MVRRFHPWLIFLAAYIVLGNLRIPAQQITGKIIGQIRVTRGDFPPHRILVELRFRGATVTSQYADAQGRFGFYDLETDVYHVVINDEDYYPVDETANVNPLQSPYAMVQILLRTREDKKKEDPMGRRASGSNPYLVDPADYNKRFPKKALKEFQKGVESEQQGKHDDAIQHYQSSLKVAPDYYPAHNNLGSLYLSKSDFKSAEEQFREAVRLDQNEAQAYFNLGNVFMLTARYTESESALESGLHRRPDSAFGHFLQGCLFGRTGRLAEAEKSLRDALQMDSSMWQAHLQLVNLYLQENRREDAINQLQTFLKAFPRTPNAPKARELLHKLRAESGAVPQ